MTTNDGDADPRLFEVGDTYDINWSGHGGGTLEDAVVVRSDTAGGDTGIIVFEGYNGGELTHVIWTPNFDLENWYWTNYGPSNPPNFYTTDQNAAYTHEYICFEKSTRIHTPRGLVPAGKLKIGETVCTWMGRAREVRWIGRKTMIGTGPAAPVRFAPGTIGNFAPVKLSPQHRVLITAPDAELQFGSSEVLVPAVSLVNGSSVRRVKKEQVTYVHILLDCHDILIAEGAPCESLLPGYRTRDILSAEDREAIRAIVGEDMRRPCRPILKRREAELIVPERGIPEREPAYL